MTTSFLGMLAQLYENGAFTGNEPGMDSVFKILVEQGYISPAGNPDSGSAFDDPRDRPLPMNGAGGTTTSDFPEGFDDPRDRPLPTDGAGGTSTSDFPEGFNDPRDRPLPETGDHPQVNFCEVHPEEVQAINLTEPAPEVETIAFPQGWQHQNSGELAVLEPAIPDEGFSVPVFAQIPEPTLPLFEVPSLGAQGFGSLHGATDYLL